VNQVLGGDRRDFRGLVGQVSPFFEVPLTVGTGRDLTGRVMQNAMGEDVVDQGSFFSVPTTNPGDRARLLGNQLGGMFPFLGAISGRSGLADTSIPLPGLEVQRAKAASQPAQSGRQRALGYLGANVRPFNLEQNQDDSLDRYKRRLKTQKKNRKKKRLGEGGTPPWLTQH
jgi:hypothetical protein